VSRKAPVPPPPPSLEAALDRIEEVARALEAEDLEMEAALALYEEGVGLLRVAESAMAIAQTRIEQLRPDGEARGPDPTEE
jgi:exodeoxyribonuclease VII small subunit